MCTQVAQTAADPATKTVDPFLVICERLRDDDPTLTILNLTNAGIGNDGAYRLGTALQYNTHLVVLFLDNNQINGGYGKSSVAVRELGLALAHHPGLEFVFMSYNALGDAGAAAMATALRTNHKIRVCKMMSSDIGPTGAKALADALSTNNKSALETLALDGNCIGREGAIALAHAMRYNTALRRLDLCYNDVDWRHLPSVYHAFCQVLMDKNKTLHTLNLEQEGPEYSFVFGGASSSDASPPEKSPLLQFYLSWNAIGRHGLGELTVPPAAWTRLLAASRGNLQLLHATLRSRPDIVQADEDDEQRH